MINNLDAKDEGCDFPEGALYQIASGEINISIIQSFIYMYLN